MPTLDLDKVSPATAAALQLGDSGDTITVPSGVTLTATDATVSLPTTTTVTTEIKTNKISPGSGTAFTFGDSGDTFNIPSGATITNSGTASGFGDCVLLSTQTVTDQASISFTSGIDNTYKEYVFVFTNINPAANDVRFTFQVNAVGGSGFDETITSTVFNAYHREDNGGTPGVAYSTGLDQAQGTAYQNLTDSVGPGSDECAAGKLHLFNPSSTTYVKNFYAESNAIDYSGPYSINNFSAGYINTALAIDEVSFKMSSGNFDGTIRMYGYT